MPFFKKRCFTLVEMICVIAIMWIVISLTTINVRNSQAAARDIVRKTDLQLIANALIEYYEDYGRFPTSIYDGQTWSISAALNLITSWWEFDTDCNFNIDAEYLPISKSILDQLSDIISNTEEGFGNAFEGITATHTDYFTIPFNTIKTNAEGIDWLQENLETIESIFTEKEKDTPLPNTWWLKDINWKCNFNITTQWMCASSLKTYLVDNWYIQSIPHDPKWSSVNLQTNICYEIVTNNWWPNANDPHRYISNDNCYAIEHTWCTQVCKEWYTYISDWEHFALIAHMEWENAWNYETTACGSCALANTCDSNEHLEQNNRRETKKRDKTNQLPCDLTDEFTNTYECMINSWLVEYSTWEFYFYIY